MENKNYAKGKNDVVSGLILCGFAAVYFYFATQIKIMKMLAATFLNASSVPKFWGVLLFLLGSAITFRGVCAIRRERKNGYVPAKQSARWQAERWLKENYAAVLMFVVLTAYVALMEPLGFLLSTILFLWAEFNVLSRREERKIVLTGVLALVCAAVIYALFRYVFTIPVPQGILKGII